MPNILPLLLPWLAVLALLALPSNRNPRAWWIWAPVIGLVLLSAGLETAAQTFNGEGFSYLVQAACAAAFGIAAIWLLGSALVSRCRALAITLMAPTFAAVSLLAFAVSPVFEQIWDLQRWESAVVMYLLLFWIVSGLAFAGALNLTGRMCRCRFGRLRVSWALLLCLCIMWLLAGGLFGCVMKFAASGNLEWTGLLIAVLVLSVVSFVVMLPFLILSFTNSFYRERLQVLLRLPTADSAPPLPMTEAITHPETAKP
jgi:hypothetical protein